MKTSFILPLSCDTGRVLQQALYDLDVVLKPKIVLGFKTTPALPCDTGRVLQQTL